MSEAIRTNLQEDVVIFPKVIKAGNQSYFILITSQLLLLALLLGLAFGLENWNRHRYGLYYHSVPMMAYGAFIHFYYLHRSNARSAILLSLYYGYLVYYSAFNCGHFAEISLLFVASGLIPAWKSMSPKGFSVFASVYLFTIAGWFYTVWSVYTGPFTCPYGLPVSYMGITWSNQEYQFYFAVAILNFIAMTRLLPSKPKM